ncbi:MAG: rod-binding protein [Tepidisphaeraceae bacterium]
MIPTDFRNPTSTAGARLKPLGESNLAFGAAVATALRQLEEQDTFRGPKPGPSEHERITTEARKWVAQTFFGTMLKQMRNSPFKSELFSGGRAGEAFSPLLDQHLADRMARGAGDKLVRGIVRGIEAKNAYRKQQQGHALPAPPGRAGLRPPGSAGLRPPGSAGLRPPGSAGLRPNVDNPPANPSQNVRTHVPPALGA